MFLPSVKFILILFPPLSSSSFTCMIIPSPLSSSQGKKNCRLYGVLFFSYVPFLSGYFLISTCVCVLQENFQCNYIIKGILIDFIQRALSKMSKFDFASICCLPPRSTFPRNLAEIISS